mmetsp:Transcript_85989/g.171733  ORF Transcript_85989/g.171733 Transcript_85989/m.171733 type:complete len:207 (-) Transcript_85989:516-1136(-)
MRDLGIPFRLLDVVDVLWVRPPLGVDLAVVQQHRPVREGGGVIQHPRHVPRRHVVGHFKPLRVEPMGVDDPARLDMRLAALVDRHDEALLRILKELGELLKAARLSELPRRQLAVVVEGREVLLLGLVHEGDQGLSRLSEVIKGTEVEGKVAASRWDEERVHRIVCCTRGDRGHERHTRGVRRGEEHPRSVCRRCECRSDLDGLFR